MAGPAGSGSSHSLREGEAPAQDPPGRHIPQEARTSRAPFPPPPRSLWGQCPAQGETAVVGTQEAAGRAPPWAALFALSGNSMPAHGAQRGEIRTLPLAHRRPPVGAVGRQHNHCSGLNGGPPKMRLHPRTYSEKGLCRCNQVKDLEMRPSWSPNPVTSVLTSRGGTGHTGDRPT